MKKIFATIALSATLFGARAQKIGESSITTWPDDKRAAVSITYDDGTLNQFRVAVPIMDRLNLPGTFYINTSNLPGSTFTARHICRSWQEIAGEAKTIPTDTENVFERTSAMRFLPAKGAFDLSIRVGSQIDAGRVAQAAETVGREHDDKTDEADLQGGFPVSVKIFGFGGDTGILFQFLQRG